MDFRGQVWKRVCNMTLFWSEIGSGIGEPGSTPQRAKKVVFDSLELVDFATVLNLPDGKCCFLGKFKLQKDCNQSC